MESTAVEEDAPVAAVVVLVLDTVRTTGRRTDRQPGSVVGGLVPDISTAAVVVVVAGVGHCG